MKKLKVLGTIVVYAGLVVAALYLTSIYIRVISFALVNP